MESEHQHETETGAFDFKRKVSCPACLDYLEAKRLLLCQKYGWSKWPEDLR
jgi:hypothetical protein